MAAISPQGNIQMFGQITDREAAEIRRTLNAGTVLATADTEQELIDMARRVKLGAQELERRAARRKQQKASRQRNR